MIRNLLRGMQIGAIIVLSAILLATVVIPRLTGSGSYTITGRSMEPTIHLGSLVVTRAVEPSAVRIGDIITFQLESGRPAVATHRVVGFTYLPNGQRAFVTEGDNNQGVADAEPVLPEQLRGVLWYTVPLVGWVNAAITGGMRAWLLPLAVSALVLYGLWMVAGGIRDRRRASADPPR